MAIRKLRPRVILQVQLPFDRPAFRVAAWEWERDISSERSLPRLRTLGGLRMDDERLIVIAFDKSA